MTIDDGDEKGLKKNELLEKLKKSFEKMDSLAAKLIAENVDLRESNDCLDPNGLPQFEQAPGQLKKGKDREGEAGEEGYQEDRSDDDTDFPSEEESEKTYEDLCSLQVRASDKLFCLLDELDGQIQENQKLRKVNAKLRKDPSPPPPYEGTEAAAEEAKQLLLESKSRVSRNDEQQDDLNKLVQKLEKKSKEISSLATNIVKESEELKVRNGLLEKYGVQDFEPQSDNKEVVTTLGSAPRDQDRNEDGLEEENRVLRARVQALKAAMRDAGKTSKATITPVLSSIGDITTSKELENVHAGLFAANLRIGQSMKAANASSDHHLACPLEPELKNARAALVAAITKIGKLETARPASSHHSELEKKRKALVAANVRIGELEKQVAEQPTPHIPSRPSTIPLPPPKLKTITAGSSAELVAANERIVELEKQLAGAIAKATEASVGKSHSSPGPKPQENVGSSSPTSGPATRLPLVSKAAVDPEATDNPPPLDTLYPTQLFIRRANLPTGSQHVKQQVKSIDSFKPPKHPSSAPSSSPPNDPPPSSSAEPLYFSRSASEWLRWLIWFFVLFMMLVGVFLCWIEWVGLNRERSMWLGANETSRMEVEGEIAKAWRSWNRVGIVFCFDRGLSLRLLKLLLSRRRGGGILFVS